MENLNEVKTLETSNTSNAPDMCQKKVLWILVAAGVFLLTVVGAALLLYSPAKTTPKTSSLYISHDLAQKQIAPQQDKQKQQNLIGLADTNLVADDTQGLQDNPFVLDAAQAQNAPSFDAQQLGLPATNATANVATNATQNTNTTNTTDVPLTANDLTVYAQNTNVYSNGTVIDLNTLKTTQPQTTQTPQIKEASPLPSPVVKQNATATLQTQKKDAPTTKPAKTTPPVNNTKKTTAVAKATSKKNTSPATKTTPTKLPDSFWVQAASYTSKKGADNAQAVLQEKNIQSDVFTYQDAQKLFYRVRVGPFTTKSEADYWLSKIVQIDEFAKTKCYVTNATGKR